MAELTGEMMAMIDSGSSRRTPSYQPLENDHTIRILILHPADDFEAPLVADLIHEDRQAAIDDDSGDKFWDAVSYTWGENPQFSSTISCNNSDLPVTPNVDALLRSFRKSHKTRRLWVDAICLNQEDNDEKKVQVQLMGEIYNEARKIVVWLGLDQNIAIDEHTVLPLSAVLTRLRRVKAHFRSSNPSPQDLSSADHILIRRFLELPWFQRRWTIQEVAVHSHVVLQLGKFKIMWSEVKSALEFLHEELKLHYKEADNASLSLKRLFWTYSDYTGILDLLWMFDLASCRDESDRIAAFQGLRILGEAPVGDIVDYTLPWYTNYIQSTRSNFGSRKSKTSTSETRWKIWVHLIAFGSLGATDPQMPSWVPDWRCSRKACSPLEHLVIEYMEQGCPHPLTRYTQHHFYPDEYVPHGSRHQPSSHLKQAQTLRAYVNCVQKVKQAFPLSLKCHNHLEEFKELFSRAPMWVLKALVPPDRFSDYSIILFQHILNRFEKPLDREQHLYRRCHLSQIASWVSNIISMGGQFSERMPEVPLDGSRHYLCGGSKNSLGVIATACQSKFIGQMVPRLCEILKDQVFIIDDREQPSLASSGVLAHDWILDFSETSETQTHPFTPRAFTTVPSIVLRTTGDESLIPQDCPFPVVRFVGISLSLLYRPPSRATDGYSGHIILV